MTESPNCTDFVIAAMAIVDGERPFVPSEAVEMHLAVCPSCRAELDGLAATSRLLDASRRAGVEVNLWPEIEPRIDSIGSIETPRRMWVPFVVLAVALVGYRALLAATPDAVFAIKIVIVVLAVGAFAFARENPFRINTELRLGQE